MNFYNIILYQINAKMWSTLCKNLEILHRKGFRQSNCSLAIFGRPNFDDGDKSLDYACTFANYDHSSDKYSDFVLLSF